MENRLRGCVCCVSLPPTHDYNTTEGVIQSQSGIQTQGRQVVKSGQEGVKRVRSIRSVFMCAVRKQTETTQAASHHSSKSRPLSHGVNGAEQNNFWAKWSAAPTIMVSVIGHHQQESLIANHHHHSSPNIITTHHHQSHQHWSTLIIITGNHCHH